MKRSLLFVTILVLSACGGGSGLPGTGANGSQLGTAQIAITIPRNAGSAVHTRKPAVVPAQTASIGVVVTPSGGTALAAQVFNVNGASGGCSTDTDGSISCVESIDAAPGSDTFAVTAYSGQNGTGSVLASASVTQTIVLNTANVVNVTLVGNRPAFIYATSVHSVNFGSYPATASGAISPSTLVNGNFAGAFQNHQLQAVYQAFIGNDSAGTPALWLGDSHYAGPNGIFYKFALNANGNALPLYQVDGTLTQLSSPQAVVVGSISGRIYVANNNTNRTNVAIFAQPAPGTTGDVNIAPDVVLGPSPAPGTGFMNQGQANTMMSNPDSVAVDEVAGEIYVSNQSQSGCCNSPNISSFCATPSYHVDVFAIPAVGSGYNNVAPKRVLCGPATQLAGQPLGIALDGNGHLFVATATAGILEFAQTAGGNVAPLAVIAGFSTTLCGKVYGIAVGSAGYIYAGNECASTIDVFAPGASGDVAPVQIITPPTALQGSIEGIAIH